MFVLDTNVISELMKIHPDPSVVDWIASVSSASLYTTTITQAEILYGLSLLPQGKRRSAIETAAKGMFNEEFSGRILTFDSKAALAYATIASTRLKLGRPISHFDAQIAAISISEGAAILTCNGKDFDQCGIKTINPWKSKP